MSDQVALRKHLLYLLNGDGAHLNLEEALKDLPAARRAERPAGSPYSAWEVLEHLRITQQDVLESLRKADH